MLKFWGNLIKGRSGIRLAKSIDLSDFQIKIAGEIDLPDVTEYFKVKKMSRRLSRFIILGHVAGVQAIMDSGIDIERAPHRYGTLIGTGEAGLTTHYENIKTLISRGMQYVPPYYVSNVIPSTPSAYLAHEWNIQGPSFSVSSACATSNHAIGLGATLIKMGMVNAVFAGGSETQINRPAMAAFGKIMALSGRNDSPETASRPFDKDRDGFVMSEGAGVMCLEELEHANKRGAQIYGEVTGYGFSCDCYDLVAPHPEGRGAIAAIRTALEMARLNSNEIKLINCHATSTILGDVMECNVINKYFGEYGKKITVQSTKSMIGHLIGAAGAVEAIAAILALKKGIIHPTTNQFEQDPEINLNVVKETKEDHTVDHILSNAFGFGGQNASIVISKFTG